LRNALRPDHSCHRRSLPRIWPNCLRRTRNVGSWW
jgi:hypothetical protein